MSLSEKRKHNTLTLKLKLEIIEKLGKGETATNLAKLYNVGRSTIYDIQKNKDKIEKFIKVPECDLSIRKTLKFGDYPKVEDALYSWFLQERNRNTSITRCILKEKAKYFHELITKQNNFQASDGWLDRFKKRYGIRHLTTNRKISNDESEFFKKFKHLMDELNLQPAQIYNANESSLVSRSLPQKQTANSNLLKTLDHKISKNQITFMSCYNRNGTHKLDLLVIGKSRNTDEFKDFGFPVIFKNLEQEDILQEIFTLWFHEYFVPAVKKFMKKANLSSKALLVLENISGYPHEDELKTSDNMIRVIFLPSKLTPLIQSINRNITEMIKSRHKGQLLRYLVSKEGDINKTLNEISLRDVMFCLAQAWESVTSSTILLSWKSLWPVITNINTDQTLPDDRIKEKDVLAVADLVKFTKKKGYEITREEITSWISENIDQNSELVIKEEIKDDDFLEQVNSDEFVRNLSINYVKPEDALKSFLVCINWAEQNGISAADILLLHDLRNKALRQIL